MKRTTVVLSIVLAAVALAALMLSMASAAPSAPASRVEFTKKTSDTTPRVGEVFTFTLRFCNVSTQTLEVRVADRNPAPLYLVIITPTTGYSAAIDSVVWTGLLTGTSVISPTPVVTVTYQVQVTGIPTTALASGHVVTNTAEMVDMKTPGSLPETTAEVAIRIMPLRIFLPLVCRNYSS